MKKALLSLSLLVIGGALIFLGFGCGKKSNGTSPEAEAPKPGDTVWQYERPIAEPISATSTANEDIVLGDLNTNAVSVVVPKGSFDADTAVTVSTPDSVPQYVGSDVQMLGAPVEISVGEPVRLNEPVTLTMKLDPAAVPSDTDPSFVRVVYYDGEKWQYIKPTSIDLQNGSVTFETYHFSFFGTTKIKDETILIEHWVHSQALDKEMRDNINKVTDHVASQIIDLTLEKMGISDESVKGKVLADLLKEDGYREIFDAATKGEGEFDMIDLNQKIAVLAGKKIAEIVPESTLQEGLANLTEAGDDVAAVAQAAGFIAEGQYKDAAKIIGETIADKFVITTAGKIAVEMVEYQIESWKSAEVDAAYMAFKKGANAHFYGYNVDPGDFDGVWSQMRGIRRQLEIEAIKKENAVRAESGMPPLTSKQEEIVRDNVYTSYKKQFEERSKAEDKIKAEEDKLNALMTAYKDAKFFDSTYGPGGFDNKGYGFEDKLELLNHFAEKMMRDTKRPEFLNLAGIRPDGKLLIADLVEGARQYFAVPDGRKKYADYLRTTFGIALYPELSALAGSWPNGILTITDVIMPEGWEEQQKSSAGSDEGCDFNIDLRALKGQTVPLPLTITPSGDAGGMLTFSRMDGEDKSMPFTYTDGFVKATFSEEGAVGTMVLGASEDDVNYILDGSFNIDYAGGQVKILTSIKSTREIPKPVAPATTKKK